MNIIESNEASKAVGPYSQAVEHNGIVYCSGQIPLDKEGNIVGDSIEEQTKQVIQNIKSILEAGSTKLENVIKVTVYLKNIDDFAVMNEVYGKYFTGKPARATVEVSKLPKNVLIELDCIAYKI